MAQKALLEKITVFSIIYEGNWTVLDIPTNLQSIYSHIEGDTYKFLKL